MDASPAERSLRARIAVRTRWAKTPDRTAATQPARDGLMSKFMREVDPDGTMPPSERAERAGHLYRAHMERMSLRAAEARRAKAAQKPGAA